MQQLAIQCDSRGATALLACGGKLVASATVSVDGDAAAVADRLRQALPQLRGGKPEVAVALDPADVRVRRLIVPPAPDDELPALVAMQAAREASVTPDDLVADFLPADGDHADGLMTAWVEQPVVDHWQAVATGLGGKLTALTPRPLPTLALKTTATSKRLIATRAGDAIDLACGDGARVLVLRSARVSDEASVQREITRTKMALSDAAAVEVDEGSAETWAAIVSSLQADEDAAHGLRSAAAATGLLLLASRGQTPALNLADPRRPAVAPTGRRRQALLAGVAAALLLAAAWMAYDRIASLDRKIEAQQALISAAEQEAEDFAPYRERVDALDAWLASDVTWLDELDRLGAKLRPKPLDAKDFAVDDDVRVTQLIATAAIGEDEPGGRIDLTAVARSSSTSELESRVRDATHLIEPIATVETPAEDAYRYKYTAVLRAPAERDESDPEEAPTDTGGDES